MKSVQQARTNPAYRASVTVGLFAYGLVHLLIAWLALQVAWGGSREEASQQGAMRELADTPFGGILLWVVAIGLFSLVIWQGLELAFGERKWSAAGRIVVYLALGISALRVATGSGGSSSNEAGQKTLSARLMAETPGRILVGLAGLVVIAVAGRHFYKAVTRQFTRDLTGGVSSGTILLGRIGYGVKGAALLIVGGLIAWAAITYEPSKAGGLDTALRTLKGQPFGTGLLTAMALGIACFGVYCFVWARNAKK
ncbi:DUF1206 domain-containing protein [Kribbella sp. NBC_01245]|uniref:DUF1206 domain-containing protein n=1 Tax=Kribbella sp. NBC_01245 TaxID=2903578 RepID=UPI002E29388B|nr:DUF1206 domain-containing protein [Kribbella sp. NBC_01245]